MASHAIAHKRSKIENVENVLVTSVAVSLALADNTNNGKSWLNYENWLVLFGVCNVCILSYLVSSSTSSSYTSHIAHQTHTHSSSNSQGPPTFMYEIVLICWVNYCYFFSVASARAHWAVCSFYLIIMVCWRRRTFSGYTKIRKFLFFVLHNPYRPQIQRVREREAHTHTQMIIIFAVSGCFLFIICVNYQIINVCWLAL